MNALHGGERTGKTLNDPRANQMTNTVEATGATARRAPTATACTTWSATSTSGPTTRSFRGGYYLDTKLNGEGCDYRTTAHAPAYYDYSTGFRCCADEGSLTDDGI